MGGSFPLTGPEMVQARSFVVLLGTLVLGAYAVDPGPPSVRVLPRTGIDLAQFQYEDATCLGYALQQIAYGSPQQAASGSAVGSAAIGTAVGGAAGAAVDAAAGGTGTGAAIGAGTGLLVGSAVGTSAVHASAGVQQQTYDIAYAQCMASSADPLQVFSVAWPYDAYGYPYAYPPLYNPWFGPVVTLGFCGRVRPGFRHSFFRQGVFQHGFHRG
jgi:hypothetical protein